VKIRILIPVKHYPPLVVEGLEVVNGTDPREVDIERNAQFAREKGAVYWDLNILTLLPNEEARSSIGMTFPTCCYIYDADYKPPPEAEPGAKVTYKAELLAACWREDLLKNEEEKKLVPDWRSQCLKGKWLEENEWVSTERPDLIGKKHTPSLVWIKLRKFIGLRPPKKVGLYGSKSDLRKWDGSELKGVRGAYIQCLEGDG
jgi:hypothetical protein